MKRYSLIGLVVLVALGAVAWRMLSQNDERIIRRTIRAAALALEKDGPENPIVATRRAERVAAILTSDPVIEGFEMNMRWGSRSEVRSAIFQARAIAEKLDVSLYNISVTVNSSREQAVLTGTARVRGVATHDRGEGREFVEFVTEWIKTPDGWRLAVLRRIEAISRIQ